MRSVEDIIAKFGTGAEFGRAIGVPTTHVGVMKRRRSIPSRYWAAVVEGARQRDIDLTLEDIARVHDHRGAPAPEQGSAA